MIFSTFCPKALCPTTLLLAVTMSDSFGDGWNGNILAIQQNNAIVGYFGNTFTTGNSKGPLYFLVQGDLQVEIVCSSVGTKTD